MEFLYQIQADPLDFLCKKKYEYVSKINNTPLKYRRNNHTKKNDHIKIEKNLDKIIKSKDFSISLNEAVKKLKVSKGYLRYRFPLKAKIIINRHRYYRRKIYLPKPIQQKEMILFAVRDLKESGEYPSLRKVFSEKYGLKKSDYMSSELNDTWRCELRMAGFDFNN